MYAQTGACRLSSLLFGKVICLKLLNGKVSLIFKNLLLSCCGWHRQYRVILLTIVGQLIRGRGNIRLWNSTLLFYLKVVATLIHGATGNFSFGLTKASDRKCFLKEITLERRNTFFRKHKKLWIEGHCFHINIWCPSRTHQDTVMRSY